MSAPAAVHAPLGSLQIEAEGIAKMHEARSDRCSLLLWCRACLNSMHCHDVPTILWWWVHLCSGQQLLFAVMVLLGVGTLLPFNVFITERTFYEVKW
jgi:hypothetical protein